MIKIPLYKFYNPYFTHTKQLKNDVFMKIIDNKLNVNTYWMYYQYMKHIELYVANRKDIIDYEPFSYQKFLEYVHKNKEKTLHMPINNKKPYKMILDKDIDIDYQYLKNNIKEDFDKFKDTISYIQYDDVKCIHLTELHRNKPTSYTDIGDLIEKIMNRSDKNSDILKSHILDQYKNISKHHHINEIFLHEHLPICVVLAFIHDLFTWSLEALDYNLEMIKIYGNVSNEYLCPIINKHPIYKNGKLIVNHYDMLYTCYENNGIKNNTTQLIFYSLPLSKEIKICRKSNMSKFNKKKKGTLINCSGAPCYCEYGCLCKPYYIYNIVFK